MAAKHFDPHRSFREQWLIPLGMVAAGAVFAPALLWLSISAILRGGFGLLTGLWLVGGLMALLSTAWNLYRLTDRRAKLSTTKKGIVWAGSPRGEVVIRWEEVRGVTYSGALVEITDDRQRKHKINLEGLDCHWETIGEHLRLCFAHHAAGVAERRVAAPPAVAGVEADDDDRPPVPSRRRLSKSGGTTFEPKPTVVPGDPRVWSGIIVGVSGLLFAVQMALVARPAGQGRGMLVMLPFFVMVFGCVWLGFALKDNRFGPLRTGRWPRITAAPDGLIISDLDGDTVTPWETVRSVVRETTNGVLKSLKFYVSDGGGQVRTWTLSLEPMKQPDELARAVFAALRRAGARSASSPEPEPPLPVRQPKREEHRSDRLKDRN